MGWLHTGLPPSRCGHVHRSALRQRLLPLPSHRWLFLHCPWPDDALTLHRVLSSTPRTSHLHWVRLWMPFHPLGGNPKHVLYHQSRDRDGHR